MDVKDEKYAGQENINIATLSTQYKLFFWENPPTGSNVFHISGLFGVYRA